MRRGQEKHMLTWAVLLRRCALSYWPRQALLGPGQSDEATDHTKQEEEDEESGGLEGHELKEKAQERDDH